MTADEKFGYWKTYAERDLDAAEAMFDSGRWFYVTIMCQQAIEKLVKGLYFLHVDESIPKVHNIGLLANRIEDKSPISFDDEAYKLFHALSKYYLSNRYPDFMNEAVDLIGMEEAGEILNKTREVFKWLLTLRTL